VSLHEKLGKAGASASFSNVIMTQLSGVGAAIIRGVIARKRAAEVKRILERST